MLELGKHLVALGSEVHRAAGAEHPLGCRGEGDADLALDVLCESEVHRGDHRRVAEDEDDLERRRYRLAVDAARYGDGGVTVVDDFLIRSGDFERDLEQRRAVLGVHCDRRVVLSCRRGWPGEPHRQERYEEQEGQSSHGVVVVVVVVVGSVVVVPTSVVPDSSVVVGSVVPDGPVVWLPGDLPPVSPGSDWSLTVGAPPSWCWRSCVRPGRPVGTLFSWEIAPWTVPLSAGWIGLWSPFGHQMKPRNAITPAVAPST